MGSLLLYSLKSSFCLLMLFSAYYFFLRNETFYHLKRFVLLGILILSLVLPMLKLPAGKIAIAAYPVSQIEKSIVPVSMQSLPSEDKNIASHHLALQNTVSPVIMVFLAGILVQVLILILSLARILRIIQKGRKIRHGKLRLILIQEEIPPFSFGRFIIISGKDYQSGAQMILDHEKVHLARRHGLDLLLARMFFIMNWYNPISFLLIREIRMNHEFEADHDVVSEGIDSYSYQMVLLRSAAGNGRFMMANHFSRNGIMRRISMLNRKKSGRWSCLKVMFLIPFLVILLQVFARPELAGRLQNRRNAVNSPYLVLDREHLAMLGIQSDEQGVYYKNMDPRWKEDHKRYSVLCFFLTEDVYCCNINLNADGEKISGSGHPYSFLRKMPAGNNDFYPLLITSLTVYPTWDAYSVFNDSTIKLLPVQLDMAAMGLRARADTMVFWFKPTQTLRETLAGITNIDRYLRIPRLKRH